MPTTMNKAFLSTQRYSDPEIRSRLSQATQDAITRNFKFDFLSKVQAGTFGALFAGEDLIAKAKTGSGKTLAFLIPMVERLRKERRDHPGARGGIKTVVIAPTRELALQILAEAHTLLTYDKSLKAEAVIGGRNISTEKSRMGFSGGGIPTVDILVGTPGRLIDHIDNTRGFAEALGAAHTLVLDEADRLLDMGFRPSLDRIVAALPSNRGAGNRQTVLFSATVSKSVLGIATHVLRPKHSFVDCVGEDEPDTNVQVTGARGVGWWGEVLPHSMNRGRVARVM